MRDSSSQELLKLSVCQTQIDLYMEINSFKCQRNQLMLLRNPKQKANQALNKLSSRMTRLLVEMHQKATHVMRMKYLLIRVELLSV